MKLTIVRVEQSRQGTIGVLKINDEAFCATLELDDENNQRNISCIPKGVYLCKRIISPKYGMVFEVEDVPNRSNILIHSGNTSNDTQGCILLGQYFGKLKDQRAVLNSGLTYSSFMKKVFGNEYLLLEIKECF